MSDRFTSSLGAHHPARRPLRRCRRSRLALAVLAAGLALAATTPAYGAGGPYVAFIDAASGQQVRIAAPNGTGSTSLTPANLFVDSFAVSQDGSTLVTGAVTGTDTMAQHGDSTQALVVTRGGVSRVISTYWDTNPVVSADGMSVWFADGDIFRYAWATNTTTRLTTGGVTLTGRGPAPGLTSGLLAVSPDGARAVVTWYATDANGNVTRDALQVRSLASPSAAVLWTSPVFHAPGAEALRRGPGVQRRHPPGVRPVPRLQLQHLVGADRGHVLSGEHPDGAGRAGRYVLDRDGGRDLVRVS